MQAATTTERCEVDGRARAFTPGDRVGSRSAQGRRTATWLPDRRGLEIAEDVTRDMGRGTFSVKNTHRWTMSAGGAELVIESLIAGPQGQIPTRRVFSRQAANVP